MVMTDFCLNMCFWKIALLNLFPKFYLKYMFNTAHKQRIKFEYNPIGRSNSILISLVLIKLSPFVCSINLPYGYVVV